MTGRPIPTIAAPRRPGDPAVLVASAERARARLGWRPARADLASIIRDAWNFARSTTAVPPLLTSHRENGR